MSFAREEGDRYTAGELSRFTKEERVSVRFTRMATVLRGFEAALKPAARQM